LDQDNSRNSVASFGSGEYVSKNCFIRQRFEVENPLRCRFANYLANFFADYVAHSCVWTSSPQSRKRLAMSLCCVSRCCDHIWKGSDHSVPLHRKLRSPIERR
jgi:hypothetical protein